MHPSTHTHTPAQADVDSMLEASSAAIDTILPPKHRLTHQTLLPPFFVLVWLQRPSLNSHCGLRCWRRHRWRINGGDSPRVSMSRSLGFTGHARSNGRPGCLPTCRHRLSRVTIRRIQPAGPRKAISNTSLMCVPLPLL